ncbi:MAG: 2-oxoglutarate dehydrogenase E1 component [Gammaproteobacteria bacterium]
MTNILQQNSHLFGANAAFIEELYEQYLLDRSSVSDRWRAYFDSLQGAGPGDRRQAPVAEEPASLPPAPRPPVSANEGPSPDAVQKQIAVLQLINAYRTRGHQQANYDPIHLRDRLTVPDLDPAFHRLTEADMDTLFGTGSLVAPDRLPLRDILALVREVYCGKIGAQYMHITETAQKRWLQQRLEGTRLGIQLSAEQRRQILQRLIAAEGLEKYLHSKYVGQKRFSLEGGESLIPLLDELIQHAGAGTVREIVIGMAHRGRLNVLVNILGKSPRELFQEFEGKYDPNLFRGSGDVKYHQGFSSDVETPGGPVHIALAFNPSHLEIVDPVVEGSVRARQQRRGDRKGEQVLPVLIHGDSAFAGQGVVMETFNLSQVRGFTTGGTIHIVVDNRIGFTTSHPQDMRSTMYCTDIAKMVEAPIFHVNGDDPEAVLFVTRLALDFRMEFKKDVVIDLVCYRRHGHNEADEPAVTQPMMYQKIKRHPTVSQVYAGRLAAEGVIGPDDADAMARRYRDALDQGEIVAHNILTGVKNEFAADWTPYKQADWRFPAHTGISAELIRELDEKLRRLPEGFELHPRVAKIMDDRGKMAAGALPLDWGFAEIMAYASLVYEGYHVRLSGQDSGRGTFFHRHAVLHNQKDGTSYIPLQGIAENQGHFTAIDSILSEEAVLAYEYGYATAEPHGLTIWEAQFGDFANGAQVVIDQFISSGEAKWGRLCGLTVFLPHGYEGQGPEHSSARLERWLQLCAEGNMQVCIPSTPAQMFHMLRRQVLRPYRTPLIVITPKSLLRHKLAVSSLESLTTGTFHPIIGEIDALEPSAVRRVVLCSGKVYYDLLEERRARGLEDVAILRIEQLYPFPGQELGAELRRYAHAAEVVWCQEEPQNQGAWYQSQHNIRACMRPNQTLRYAGRPASASPAAGYFNLHIQQQAALVNDALSMEPDPADEHPAAAQSDEQQEPRELRTAN